MPSETLRRLVKNRLCGRKLSENARVSETRRKPGVGGDVVRVKATERSLVAGDHLQPGASSAGLERAMVGSADVHAQSSVLRHPFLRDP